MTLIQIVTAALIECGFMTDAKSMDSHKQKFTTYINDGIRDLADVCGPFTTETVTVTDGEFDVNSLSRAFHKLKSVTQNGKTVIASEGSSSSMMAVDANGEVKVSYYYTPKGMSSDTDSPDLIAAAHPLLVTFATARYHSSADPTMQRRANVYYELYEDGKKKLRRHLGTPDKYKISNAGW